MDRRPGLSARVKLTLSYVGFLMVAGALMLAAAWFVGQYSVSSRFFLPYSPNGVIHTLGALIPGNNSYFLREYVPAAAVAIAVLLLFGILGGWLLAGRMLAPLSRITAATRIATSGSLSHRIELDGRQDEFRELADSFDAMLARLEAHLAEQRRFAANASHELRTPLATTQTLLEVARSDPNQDMGELVERLYAVNARAIELTEALLLLSRADQRSFTRANVDVSLVAEEAAEILLPLAEQFGVSVQTSGEIAPTFGSHALLLQMTTNLLHNAIVYNLPDHGTVQVTTANHAEFVTLTVENTGPSLTRELISTLTEPFQRGTERIRTNDSGVGLGLAIVKSIAEAHDGTLSIVPGSDGGIRVTARLPNAIAPGMKQLQASSVAPIAESYRVSQMKSDSVGIEPSVL